MAGPIKASDLYQDDGAIRKAIEELKALGDTLERTLKQIKKEAGATEATVKKLAGTSGENREEIKRTATEADKLKARYDATKKAIEENDYALEQLKQAQSKLTAELRLEAKIRATQEGSYDNLSAQYSLLKLRLNGMSAAQREATEEGQALEKQAFDIYQQMKALQEATGKHTLSVGDYEKATRGLLEQLKDVPGAAGQAAGGVEGLGQQFKALLRNPVVLVIAAIVGALSALFAAFKQSETGAKLFARIGGTIQGVWSGLIGLVSSFAETVVKAFEDPVGAMKGFWEALKENIVNRFEALIDLTRSLGKVLSSLWNRDLEALRTAAGEAGTALVQLGTGLDAAQQSAFSDAIKEQTENVQNLAKAFGDLAVRRREVEAQNRRLATQVEALMTEEELLASTRDDATKSFKEREDAGAKFFEAAKQRAKVEQQIARNTLSLLDTELSLRRRNGENVAELEEQRLGAFQALSQAERDYLLLVREAQREQDQLKQDRLEKDLDILIDGVDNAKTINERLIADETIAFEKRRALLEETRKLIDDSYAKQVETIQQFTGVAVDANDLINTLDAETLNNKIRALGLSEVIEGRLLEVIRERRTFVQDLAEAERDLAKAEIEAAEAAKKAAIEQRKADYDRALATLEQEQELQTAKMDLQEMGAAERAKAELEMEKEKLKQMLALNEQYQQGLTDTQIETIETQIAVIDKKLAAAASETGDIYDLFGLSLKDEQKAVIADSFAFAKQQLDGWMQKRVEAANQAVENSRTEVEQAQAALEAEMEYERNGFASKVDFARKELEEAKKNQAKALEEQRKAQRAQQALAAIQQATNLVTASSKILAELTFPFSLAAIALLWGSFAAAQAKAFQVTKYEKGGFEDLNYGGSHQSGNDISLGVDNRGRERRVERGEGLGIFNRKAMQKYGSVIPDIVKAINQGVLENRYTAIEGAGADFFQQVIVDTGRMEKELVGIRKQGEKRTYIDEQGRLVEIQGNRKRTYV